MMRPSEQLVEDAMAYDLALETKLGRFSEGIELYATTPEQKNVAKEKANKLKEYLLEANRFKSEAKVAQVLLEGMGFEVTDPSIWSKIGETDIVEAYDLNGRQLYCNALFIKTTTYQIEEFLLHDAFDLFIRPQRSLEEVKAAALSAVNDSDTAIAVDVAPYVIQERFSQLRAKFRIHHKFMCGLRDGDTGQKIGFLSTIQVEPVSGSVAILGS